MLNLIQLALIILLPPFAYGSATSRSIDNPIGTKEEDPEWLEDGEIHYEARKLKEEFIGHYHGLVDDKSVYVELSPYVYKLYTFEGFMDLEEFKMPSIGTWGINPKNPHLIHLDIRIPPSNIIAELALLIKEDRSLEYIPDQIPLTPVEINFVPMLYHFNRNVADKKGSIVNHNSDGILEIQNNFPDYKDVINKEATDIANLGFLYQTGQIAMDYESLDLTDPKVLSIVDESSSDLEKARELYETAAAMGYPPAMYNLARMYEDSEWAFEQDLPKYLKLLTEASELEHTSSEERLGTLLFYGGEGIEINKERGVELWHKAAEKANAEAQFRYGNYLFSEKPDATAEEKNEGVAWIRSAAGRDYPDAFFKLFEINDQRANEELCSSLQEEAAYFLMQACYLRSEPAVNYFNRMLKLHENSE